MKKKKTFKQIWLDTVLSSDGPGKSTERLVASGLWIRMGNGGGSCFPSVQSLTKYTRLSDRAVRDALHALVEQGWLTREKRGRGYTYQARLPEVPIPAPDAAVEKPTPADDSTTPAPHSTTPAPHAENTGTTCRLINHEQTSNKPEREKTTLPQDFGITREMLEWAEQELDPSIDIDHATKKFCEWHGAEGSTRVDWQAAWRKWMLDEQPPQTNGQGNGGGWDAVQARLEKEYPDDPVRARAIKNYCKDQNGIKPWHVLEALKKGSRTDKEPLLAAAGREAGRP